MKNPIGITTVAAMLFFTAMPTPKAARADGRYSMACITYGGYVQSAKIFENEAIAYEHEGERRMARISRREMRHEFDLADNAGETCSNDSRDELTLNALEVNDFIDGVNRGHGFSKNDLALAITEWDIMRLDGGAKRNPSAFFADQLVLQAWAKCRGMRWKHPVIPPRYIQKVDAGFQAVKCPSS